MRIILLIILVLIFGYALALVLFNSEPLSVNLVFTHVPAMNSGLLLIICIGLGIMIGLLLALQLFRVFQLKWENSRLKREIKSLRKEQVDLAAKAASQATSQPSKAGEVPQPKPDEAAPSAKE